MRPLFLYPVFSALLSFCLMGVFVTTLGCSGTSGGKPFVYPYPIPTDLQIHGAVNLAEVSLSNTLGGITPSVKTSAIRSSLLDHSPFKITVEDDPKGVAAVATDGKFILPSLAIRDQIVVRSQNQDHPGFVLEWMGVGTPYLLGEIEIQITVKSTARALIVRNLRNRFGRLISPESLSDATIASTVLALYDVLEQHPEGMSATTPLGEVASVLAAVIAAATAIDQKAQTTPSTAPWPRDWTVLVYQGGDNSLAPALKEDLEEMKLVKLPSRVTLLVQSDSPEKGIRRLWITDGQEKVLGELGAANSADPLLLADFVRWAQRAFPARRFALIIASHGFGWRGPAGLLQATDRGLVSDDSAQTYMDFLSLSEGLKYGVSQPGGALRPLEFLGFDACLMGLAETAFQIRNYGRWLAFSQANEPSSGWPYQPIFAALASNPAGLDGKAWGTIIGQEYQEDLTKPALSGRYSGTLSLIDLGKMDAVKTALQNWVQAILAHTPVILPTLTGLRDAVQEGATDFDGAERYRVQAFELTDQRDAIDLIASLNSLSPLTALTGEALIKTLKAAITVNTRFGTRYVRAQGLSLALPSPTTFVDYQGTTTKPGYAYLDLPRDSGWVQVLTLINQGSASGPADSRTLATTLDWNTTGDLDLWIGEPDPVAPSDPNRINWYSPADGVISPNGRFSSDSRVSGLSEESWTANRQIQQGTYWMMANFFSRSANTQATRARFKIWTSEHRVESLREGLIPGNQFEAARIQVESGEVLIELIPEPQVPEPVIKSLEKALVTQNAGK